MSRSDILSVTGERLGCWDSMMKILTYEYSHVSICVYLQYPVGKIPYQYNKETGGFVDGLTSDVPLVMNINYD